MGLETQVDDHIPRLETSGRKKAVSQIAASRRGAASGNRRQAGTHAIAMGTVPGGEGGYKRYPPLGWVPRNDRDETKKSLASEKPVLSCTSDWGERLTRLTQLGTHASGTVPQTLSFAKRSINPV